MNKAFIEAGKRLSRIFAKTLAEIKPGRKLREIDSLADKFISKSGGKASFKGVGDYQWATCINLNEGVVHGIPDNKIIKRGDVVSLDMGFEYQGCHADMAYTLQIQNPKSLPTDLEVDRFLEAGKKALDEAIRAVRAGNRVGHISKAIQEIIEEAGYSCVRELTGHGIGGNLHQPPWIPCRLTERIEKTPLLKEGVGLAIEVIYTLGKADLEKMADGWTIKTRDGKISALFEKTVLVTKKGVRVVTPEISGDLVV